MTITDSSGESRLTTAIASVLTKLPTITASINVLACRISTLQTLATMNVVNSLYAIYEFLKCFISELYSFITVSAFIFEFCCKGMENSDSCQK